MAEPSADAPALPADTLPPELQGLVELDAGSVRFTRGGASADLARVVALGVSAPLFGLGAVALVVAGMNGGTPWMGTLALMAAPFAGVFAAWAMARPDRWIAASAEGIDGEPWGPAAALHLVGSARTRSARLVLERADGELVVLRRWWDLPPHVHRGWDHDSVRWFAARIAELAGAPLLDDLPAVDAYQASWDTLDGPPFDPEGAARAEPIPPRETFTHDGLTFHVAGGMPVGLVQAALENVTTSRAPDIPVRVTATHVHVGVGSRPVSAIVEVRAWFGLSGGRRDPIPVGRVVAVTRHGQWVLVERRLGSCEPGHVVGAAQAIRAAVQLAQRRSRERGSEADVPEPLRAIAARDDGS